MADKRVKINPRYLTYNKDEVQHLLDEVRDRAFFAELQGSYFNA